MSLPSVSSHSSVAALHRSVSRWGCGLDGTDEQRARSAKMLAILQISQGGTIYVYQGEEIGMANFSKSWGIEEYKDVATQLYWTKYIISAFSHLYD